MAIDRGRGNIADALMLTEAAIRRVVGEVLLKTKLLRLRGCRARVTPCPNALTPSLLVRHYLCRRRAMERGDVEIL